MGLWDLEDQWEDLWVVQEAQWAVLEAQWVDQVALEDLWEAQEDLEGL